MTCKILGILANWAFFVFFGAADLVMILRVWAIYRGSRIILGVLLTLYVMQMVPFLITCILANIGTTGM
ncbi:hypothetical protein V8E55_002797 [Tylopilus felleus]